MVGRHGSYTDEVSVIREDVVPGSPLLLERFIDRRPEITNGKLVNGND
jgi:hypothetical protein